MALRSSTTSALASPAAVLRAASTIAQNRSTSKSSSFATAWPLLEVSGAEDRGEFGAVLLHPIRTITEKTNVKRNNRAARDTYRNRQPLPKPILRNPPSHSNAIHRSVALRAASVSLCCTAPPSIPHIPALYRQRQRKPQKKPRRRLRSRSSRRRSRARNRSRKLLSSLLSSPLPLSSI